MICLENRRLFPESAGGNDQMKQAGRCPQKAYRETERGQVDP